jgi:NADPH:quinone reductase-like Zn-dependent oxidoreductase
MVRSIGAAHVIDYTKEDFTHNDGKYDLIYDAVRKRSFSDCRLALSPQGTYVTTAWSTVLALQEKWVSMTGSQNMVLMNPMDRPDEKGLLELKELIEAGKVTPFIDRRYTLSELPEELRHYGTGHSPWKIIINII